MAQYTDITETSKLLGLSVTALRRGARSGRFPHIRSGGGNNPRGKLLFDLRAVAQVLAEEAYTSMQKEDVKKE